MDTEKQPITLSYTATTMPPAQLWVGQHDQLLQEVYNCAQKMFCPHHGCQTCVTCMHIRNHQHHALMWLHPDKTYTIEQLDDLFSKIAFQLKENELFFFIIQKADLLTTACANKLLKAIEEPPTGYHFILLAERTENILPTILSRCIINSINELQPHLNQHPLFASLTTDRPTTTEFSKILDTYKITEQDSIKLLDAILEYWILQYKMTPKSFESQHARIATIINNLKKAYTQLPMPGSTIIFWRTVYLMLKP